MFNILTRRFVGADEVEGYDFRKAKGKVMAKIRVVWEKVKVKVKGGDRTGIGDAGMEKKVQ